MANATSNATTVIRDVKRHPRVAQTSTKHLPAEVVPTNAQKSQPMQQLSASIRLAALNATWVMQNVHQGNAFQPTRPRTVAPAIIGVYSFPMALRLVTMESASSHVILVIFSKMTNACPLVLVALELVLAVVVVHAEVAVLVNVMVAVPLNV